MAYFPQRRAAIAHLEQLLDHHRKITTGIETTLALLKAQDKDHRGPIGPVLDQALALDAARVNGHAVVTPKKAGKGYDARAIAQRRRRTAELLKTYDDTTPQPSKEGHRISVLLQHGYLKKKGNGYVRTAKPFTP